MRSSGAALWWTMFELYFGEARQQCDGALLDESRHAIDTLIGFLPMLGRSVLLGVAWKLCRKVTGVRRDGLGLAAALLTVGSDGRGDRTAGRMGGHRRHTWCRRRRGSDAAAIDVGGGVRRAQADAAPGRVVGGSQAAVLALEPASGLPLHALPVPLLHRLAGLGEWQQRFTAIVAAREVLYFPGYGPNVSYTGEPLCACNPSCDQGTCLGLPGGTGRPDGTCRCNDCWSDSACDHATGCDGNPCGSHGSCSANGGSHTCQCDGGWNGDTCDTCAAGYIGEHCATAFAISGVSTFRTCNGIALNMVLYYTEVVT